ncbi:MAG: efflux RND transporter periplasmic adaptor subunit [Flavobacteriales bacterium]
MKKTIVLSLMLISAFFVSCKKEAQTQQQKPVMPYKVIEIKKSNTTLTAEYPTTLEGKVDVEIRPKVDGYIEKIFIDEGQVVKKGQLLYKLETQSATQEAAAAKAQVNAAQVEVNRLAPLVKRNIISQVQLETAKANLATVKSNYETIMAKINYATIKSPVNGVVGTLNYRIGSYVSSQTALPLTQISDIETVYANFSITEKQQLDIMFNTEGKTLQDKIAQMPPVTLVMSNGKAYDEKGKIETFGGQANAETGSYNVRAKFENPNKILRSGSTGVIQLPNDLKDVIVIPQKATMELQDKYLALVLDKDNKVKMASIEVREVPGGKYYVVDKGLEEGEKIVVEGVGILAEGTDIKPVPTTMEEFMNPSPVQTQEQKK